MANIFRRYSFKKIFFAVFLISICSTAFANPLRLNKDYIELANINSTQANLPQQKIEVIEFFNYGCPACNRLNPLLEKWLASKPANIEFRRVPVVFEPGWDVYAKTFHLLDALGQENRLNPLIFADIHKKGENLSSAAAMTKFLTQNGIAANDVANGLGDSPAMALQLHQDEQLMRQDQVYEIPSFVVAGRYKTSAGMTNGNSQQLLNIVQALSEKASQKDQKNLASK